MKKRQQSPADLNAEPNETGWGEVLGGGRFPYESDDTITAIPASGFAFVSWSDGVTDSVRVVHLLSDTTFTAIFQCTQQFNLQVSASDATMGTVTGDGSYTASDVTITATPNPGHRFNNWSCDDGSTVITTNPLVVHLVSDTAFVANFEDVSEQTFTLQVSSANTTMGTSLVAAATLAAPTKPSQPYPLRTDTDSHIGAQQRVTASLTTPSRYTSPATLPLSLTSPNCRNIMW